MRLTRVIFAIYLHGMSMISVEPQYEVHLLGDVEFAARIRELLPWDVLADEDF